MGWDMSSLFDVAACRHEDTESCNCSPEKKVPSNWMAYLQDQRGPRKSKALLSNRARSLLDGIRDLTEAEKEEQQILELNSEKQKQMKERLEKRKRKSEEDVEMLFQKATIESDEESLEVNAANCDEDEWEDEDEDWDDGGEYNTLKLKYFAREVDRYQWSDRGAAKVASGLLKDLGLVKKGDTKMLICPAAEMG